MKLRHPNPGDMEQILSLGRLMHAESWYADLDFDDDTVIRLVEASMTSEKLLALVLEASDGTIAGFFCAAETEHFFGTDRYACDIATFVAPAHRGGPGFVRMIRAYEAWCRIRGVKEIHIGFSSGVTPEKTQGLYARLGFTNPVTAWRKKCVWPPPGRP